VVLATRGCSKDDVGSYDADMAMAMWQLVLSFPKFYLRYSVNLLMR
jgi:hypothetical protein